MNKKLLWAALCGLFLSSITPMRAEGWGTFTHSAAGIAGLGIGTGVTYAIMKWLHRRSLRQSHEKWTMEQRMRLIKNEHASEELKIGRAHV